MLEIDNQATGNDWTDACTLGPTSNSLSIAYVIANAACRVQLAPLLPSGTLGQWGAELLLTPQSNTVQHVGGMRFRSAVAGAPARVVAQLFQPDDPILGAGTAFTGTLAANGSLSPAAVDQPYFRVARQLSVQSIPNGVATNAIFDSAFAQSDQFWTGATPDQIIIPATAGAGVYYVSTLIRWAASAAGTIRQIVLTQIGSNQEIDFAPPNANGVVTKLGGLFTAAVLDTFKVSCFQDSGAPLNLSIGSTFNDISIRGFKVHS